MRSGESQSNKRENDLNRGQRESNKQTRGIKYFADNYSADSQSLHYHQASQNLQRTIEIWHLMELSSAEEGK